MTKTEILDAINLLLVSKWPDRTVYVDVCPVDFNRPSFWLTVEKYDPTDGNRGYRENCLQDGHFHHPVLSGRPDF